MLWQTASMPRRAPRSRDPPGCDARPIRYCADPESRALTGDASVRRKARTRNAPPAPRRRIAPPAGLAIASPNPEKRSSNGGRSRMIRMELRSTRAAAFLEWPGSSKTSSRSTLPAGMARAGSGSPFWWKINCHARKSAATNTRAATPNEAARRRWPDRAIRARGTAL